MTLKPKEIKFPILELNHCSVDEHAQALLKIKRLPFWWYQGIDKVLGNFSLPFRDRSGNWWYQVKPGLCWAVDFFKPLPAGKIKLPFQKSFMGFQYVIDDQSQANSRLVINTVQDLHSYGPCSIEKQKRSGVRKGFDSCTLTLLKDFDLETVRGCLVAWNSLALRTGWKKAQEERQFFESWKMLLDCPGVSIIVCRLRETGEVAGFHIVKIIGDTAYGDTYACRTDMLGFHVNDALTYVLLANSARIPGVTKAHSAIKSYVETLERFKTSLGYIPYPFPARTELSPGVGVALKLFFPAQYNRMTGNI